VAGAAVAAAHVAGAAVAGAAVAGAAVAGAAVAAAHVAGAAVAAAHVAGAAAVVGPTGTAGRDPLVDGLCRKMSAHAGAHISTAVALEGGARVGQRAPALGAPVSPLARAVVGHGHLQVDVAELAHVPLGARVRCLHDLAIRIGLVVDKVVQAELRQPQRHSGRGHCERRERLSACLFEVLTINEHHRQLFFQFF